MKNPSHLKLPTILVLDDQFGRCGLGGRFKNSVDAEIFEGYTADRRNLCFNYGLFDITGDIRPREVDDPIAKAIFCPAQIWNAETEQIENSYEIAERMVQRGWPFEDSSRWGLILLDLRFVYGKINTFGDPEEGSLFGVEVLLPRLREKFGDDLPVVVLSSTAKDENNPIVRRLGALDFIQRLPGAGAPPQDSREALKKALRQHGLIEDSTGKVLGRSLHVLKMLRLARRGAQSARNILLLGETGTGKGLLAEYIHDQSSRKDRPFQTFHAAHRPSELQADELFGHWKGAFTGAANDSPGIWERADGGTLFIDEVADINIDVQQMLMQPIEERKVKRLGQRLEDSTTPHNLDVLVLLATNRDLSASISPNSIKLDFLNRINAFTIEVPPLRDRREDIPILVDHLAKSILPNWRGRILPEALQDLSEHDWQEGNVRELRNVIERALVNNPDQDITSRDIILSIEREKIAKTPQFQIETHIEGTHGDLWKRFAGALRTDPGEYSVKEFSKILDDLQGGFLDLLAHALIWSLEANKSYSKLNLTATARFLLGRKDLSTMEAKQFLKKLLTIDTRDKTLAKMISESELVIDSDALSRLLEEILS